MMKQVRYASGEPETFFVKVASERPAMFPHLPQALCKVGGKLLSGLSEHDHCQVLHAESGWSFRACAEMLQLSIYLRVCGCAMLRARASVGVRACIG